MRLAVHDLKVSITCDKTTHHLTHALLGVTVHKQSVYPGQGVVSLAVKEVDSRSKHLHLFPDRCDLVPGLRQQLPDRPQLLSAVLDVPHFIVKMPRVDMSLSKIVNRDGTMIAYFAR